MDKSNELQNSMFNDTKNLSIEELNKNIAEIDKKHELISEKLLQIHNKAFAWYKKAAKAKKSEWNHDYRFHRKYAKDWVKEFTNIVEIKEKALSGDAEAMYKYSE